MERTILLAAALQRWDTYSALAIAARKVAAALAHSAANPLHVLSVYDYASVSTDGLPADMAATYREEQYWHTDVLMRQKMEAYVEPLLAKEVQITTLLRVGNPREVIVQVAREVQADLLIIGSHSKRGVHDVGLGGTAQAVSKYAPCTVMLVASTTPQ